MKISKQKLSGFTLLEVMIVVAIVGILAAIVFPSYRKYVMKVNREAAIAEMNGIGQQLERAYTVNNGAYPQAYSISEQPRGYNVTVTIPNDRQSYTLVARPDSTQAKEVCGTLVIDSGGTRNSYKTYSDAEHNTSTGRSDCFK